MAQVTNSTPHLTILRLRAMYPDMFYTQNWYDAEEFVSKALIVGTYDLGGLEPPEEMGLAPSAIEVVNYMVREHETTGKVRWGRNYIWTSDRDSNGDRVYVGGYYLSDELGIQIHRHLTIDDKWINVGYTMVRKD